MQPVFFFRKFNNFEPRVIGRLDQIDLELMKFAKSVSFSKVPESTSWPLEQHLNQAMYLNLYSPNTKLLKQR